MLRSTKDLRGYGVVASNGELGAVNDVYFDDEQWVVRYVVVDTARWLAGRHVLISPLSVEQPDWVTRRLPVALTCEQVRNSPGIDSAKPVSRQQERELFRYYGYPFYWRGAPLWGVAPYPWIAAEERQSVGDAGDNSDIDKNGDDAHLRSCREVAGYHMRATDGTLGHADDFLFDDLDWAIRYVVVDTSNWWFGRHVLIPPEWIDTIDWQTREIRVGVSRREMKGVPEYDAAGHVNRQWEAHYYAQHKRKPYWIPAGKARQIRARQRHPPVITK